MKTAILRNKAPDGEILEAIYAPENGMNLISYRKGNVQVIDQKTMPLFKQRSAGLGAFIGPHFHEQKQPPENYDNSLFPHVKKMKEKGRKDPFSHGIARYVPWKFVNSETQIQAELKGSDLYQGVSLKTFEGQDFHLKYEARLLCDGLFISTSIKSERPSLIGLHYYYRFSENGSIMAEVKKTYRDQNEWKLLPPKWTDTRPTHLSFKLPQIADFGFIPTKRLETEHDFHLNFNTKDYSLRIEYNTSSDSEISCQIFHPENASYVCIEPLSAKNPTDPQLNLSHLEAKIQIFSPQNI